MSWKSKRYGDTGIKSMNKMKIGRKLLFTYFILLLATVLITGITFGALLQRYLISETRAALRQEAQTIINTLDKSAVPFGKTRPNLALRREIRIMGQFINSKLLLLNKDKDIIYSNLEEAEKKLLQPVFKSRKLKSKGYIFVQMPVYDDSKGLKGYLVLFSKVQDIDGISRLMKRTQAMSLAVGGVFAVFLGMILQSGLTKPIRKLQTYMSEFTLKAEQPEINIRTGDEIEELADCFSAMVQRLKRYDIQQKRFLQNASHELKTPLMSIQGYAEAVKDGVVDGDEVGESLDVIIDESKRMKKLVDEMIYLVKLENVEETFSFEAVSIEEVIKQSVKTVKAVADAGGIAIRTEGDCNYTGCFDKEKLVRVFVNILSNGIRYAESEIVVRCINNRDYIEMIIKDDGRGFQDGEENKVFERFYKGEKGGSGIGLAIAKAIVDGHHGRIEAGNAEPKGAVFKVTLPGKPGLDTQQKTYTPA